MKLTKAITCLEAMTLSFLLSFAGVMCLPTAFSLSADPDTIALVCGICALVCALCLTGKLALVPLGLLALGAGYWWQEGTLFGSVEALLAQITKIYDAGYGLGILYWSASPPLQGDVTAALCAMGCLVSLLTAWTVCRRLYAVVAIVPAILPLAACLVVNDRVPSVAYLFWLMLGVVVLLLSQSVRRKDPSQGNRLAALVTVPVVLAQLLLFWAIPQKGYAGQALADRILVQVQSWMGQLEGPANVTAAQPADKVDLAQTGTLLQLHTPVMTVKSDRGGILYLREQGYHRYDGQQWYNTDGIDLAQWNQWEQFESAGQVSITTRNLYQAQFVPYYVSSAAVNSGGITHNDENLYSYTFDLLDMVSAGQTGTREQIAWAQKVPDAISMTDETAAWAVPLSHSITQNTQGVLQAAQAIGDYVRQSAAYSKSVGRMPAGQTDFSQWFLAQSDRGYCVHFATAAAVLLRASGIPAQYVTGYMVSTAPGQTTTVYQDQAHAWVEYYDPAVGWRILEATPSEGLQGGQNTFQGQQPEYPETTQPPQSQPPETIQPSTPGTDDTTAPQQDLGWLWQLLVGVGVATVAALLVIGQWQLRVRLQEAQLHTGSANERALACWQQVVRLSRLTGQRPEPALFATAQKAKFSQYTLQESELAPLDTFIRQNRRALKQRPWYCQILYTVIFAVY